MQSFSRNWYKPETESGGSVAFYDTPGYSSKSSLSRICRVHGCMQGGGKDSTTHGLNELYQRLEPNLSESISKGYICERSVSIMPPQSQKTRSQNHVGNRTNGNGRPSGGCSCSSSVQYRSIYTTWRRSYCHHPSNIRSGLVCWCEAASG
jgi:hypothetical protein